MSSVTAPLQDYQNCKKGLSPRSQKTQRVISGIAPAAVGTALYALNNLGVLHALFAAPKGYVPMGIYRDNDVAQYLTWIAGLAHHWTLPNYHAAWRTEPAMIVPAMSALAKLCSWTSLNTVVALQGFTVLGYVLTSYAAAFALRTFCNNRREAFAAVACALACVPVRSLLQVPGMLLGRPGWQRYGAHELLDAADGFLRGLANCPFETYGTFTVILSVPLAAWYLLTRDRKWVWFLAADCFFSAFIHPFEIFPIFAALTILLLRYRNERWRGVAAEFGAIGAASAAGLAVYVVPVLRHPWLREVTARNRTNPTPSWLLADLGIPVVLSIFLLLLGVSHQKDVKATVLRVWFVVTLLVVYAPRVPWSFHMLDGFNLLVGLLIVDQTRGILQSWRPAPWMRTAAAAAAVLALAVMIGPHFTTRAVAWSDGISTSPLFRSAIAVVDEPSLVQWFRKNAAPTALVLAPRAQAPWIATAPVHSFGGHWIFSLLTPSEEQEWSAFYSGKMSRLAASSFLATYGFSFVVVPSNNPAREYVRNGAELAARVGEFEVFRFSDATMKDGAEIHDKVALLNRRDGACQTGVGP